VLFPLSVASRPLSPLPKSDSGTSVAVEYQFRTLWSSCLTHLRPTPPADVADHLASIAASISSLQSLCLASAGPADSPALDTLVSDLSTLASEFSSDLARRWGPVAAQPAAPPDAQPESDLP
jgi:hypothetical protein